MPGFNATGPMGKGPMTGGGRGFCVVPVEQGMPIMGVGRGGRPYGGGRGRCFGGGHGAGREFGWAQSLVTNPPVMAEPIDKTIQDRLDALASEIESLKAHLEVIERKQPEEE